MVVQLSPRVGWNIGLPGIDNPEPVERIEDHALDR
jgi:hypothetical protein